MSFFVTESVALTLTQALVRCPSVTPQESGTLDLIAAALAPLGFHCRRYTFEGNNSAAVENMVATWGQGQPHFAFAGHVDVVPVGDARAWTHDPFAAVIENGRLYGRGSADMKSGIACFIDAAARLIRETPPKGAISLLITCDEEGPSVNGTAPLIRKLAEEGVRFDACVVGEPSSYEKFGDMVKIGRRGSLSGDIVVKGKQGHVAYPDRANNPVPRLLRILTALENTVIDEGTPDFQPSNLEIVSVDVGNPTPNIIPAQARALFNIRFNDLHSGQSLSEKIRAICDGTGEAYDISFRFGAEPFLTKAGPLSASLIAAIQSVAGLVPKLSTTGGTSDARFIAPFCPVVEFGLLGQTIHQVDEHVNVAEIEQLTRVYHVLLQNWFAAQGAHANAG